MKKQIVYWFGLVFVLSLLLAACSSTTAASNTDELKKHPQINFKNGDRFYTARW
jgi:hypothetical protein